MLHDFHPCICFPPQRTCTFCTPWWPWTTLWVQFEITIQLFNLNYPFGVIFVPKLPSTTEKVHFLHPLTALNNSVGPIWDHHLTFNLKLPLWCDFWPSTAFHHREAVLVAPLDGLEQLRGSNLISPMNLVGPITIDTIGIKSPRYSMWLSPPRRRRLPLLDLLGFAASKNTCKMLCWRLFGHMVDLGSLCRCLIYLHFHGIS